MNKIFIGIDFSKEKFDATVITAEGVDEQCDRQHGVFSNDVSGFRQFERWCRASSGGTDLERWLFCGEDTGGYKAATPSGA